MFKAKSLYLLFSLMVFISVSVSAQGTWTQKTNFSGIARHGASSFSIGTKGYMGTGYDGTGYQDDFWEWDQSTNVWTQKASLPGVARSEGVGFSIGTKGYIGTGYDGTYLKDFWEWDQASNTWTAKTNFPAAARYWAVGFSIGNKGYIGTGENTNGQYNDFWEWDQVSNAWTRKANFAGSARRGAVSFSIGTKGYIGTGFNNAGYLNDFWEWDQASNTWISRANLGGPARAAAVGFSIGTKGYIGTGVGPSNLNDFWEWNQSNNSWTQKTNFGGSARFWAAGFSIGCNGYIAAGNDGSLTQDLWEFYDASACNPITIAAMATAATCNSLCNGTAVAIPTGGIAPYVYSWSDGTTDHHATGLCAGTYSVSITDSLGQTTSSIITIDQPAKILAVITANSSILAGSATTLIASGGVSYTWSPAATLSCTDCPNPIASPSVATTYCVRVTDGNQCIDSTCITINVETICNELFIPNVFSPNNDGENDVFYVKGNCIDNLILTIYDRWGEKVFETADSNLGWDGVFRNEKMSAGVYVYSILIPLPDKTTVIKHGNISLLR